MNATPRPVATDQQGIHPRLKRVVNHHLQHSFRRPPAPHAAHFRTQALARLNDCDNALILDSGCGTGASTVALAERFCTALVVGVDRSEVRLARARARRDIPENVLFVRANLEDCWSLLAQHEVRLSHHFLLYPNPWPKQRHLMRRWHAHPLMPLMLGISRRLELRTNWRIYAEEFAASIELHGNFAVTVAALSPQQPISAFEKKYLDAGQQLYCVRAEAF